MEDSDTNQSEYVPRPPGAGYVSPRSLANLRPPWTPATAPNPNGNRGPLVTPAIRRLFDKSESELYALLEKPNLSIGEKIAARVLLEAAQLGYRYVPARALLLDRLDGVAAKQPVDVAVDVSIQLTWNPGEQSDLPTTSP
jgi:hypothetical protein